MSGPPGGAPVLIRHYTCPYYELIRVSEPPVATAEVTAVCDRDAAAC